jgi:hypothetical protein
MLIVLRQSNTERSTDELIPPRYLQAQPFPLTFTAVNFGRIILVRRDHDFAK